MLERMRVAWRAHARPAVDEPAMQLVRRSGARTREWLRAVRTLVQGASGYRGGAVPEERLWRIVEDTRADRSARTGAAFALAPLLDESGRVRMNAAASGCAEPRLRTALSMAASEVGADGVEDEIAAALDANEGEGEEDGEDRAILRR